MRTHTHVSVWARVLLWWHPFNNPQLLLLLLLLLVLSPGPMQQRKAMSQTLFWPCPFVVNSNYRPVMQEKHFFNTMVTSAFNNTLYLSWAETAAGWPLYYVTSLMRLDYAHSCEPAANLLQSWFTMFGLLFPLTTMQHLYILLFYRDILLKSHSITWKLLETSATTQLNNSSLCRR